MARILIVDDASFARNTLKYIVERAGHTVVGLASDGDEALSFYRATKPDIVTMDLMMERMDGLTALMNILKYDPEAKVIIVSILSTAGLHDEGIKLGAVGYVNKPVKPEDMIKETNKVLASSSEKGD